MAVSTRYKTPGGFLAAAAPAEVLVFPPWMTSRRQPAARAHTGAFIDTSNSKTSGIQEAIDYLASLNRLHAGSTTITGLAGGRIRLFEGEYLVTESILVTMSGIDIVGAGYGTVIKNAGSTASGLLVVQGASQSSVRGLRIETDDAYDSVPCLEYTSSASGEDTDIAFEDLWLLQAKHNGDGFKMTNAGADLRRVLFRDIRIRYTAEEPSTWDAGTGDNVSNGMTVGINDAQGYDLTIDNLMIDGAFLNAFNSGGDLGSWQRVSVKNSKFRGAVRHGARFYHFGESEFINCNFEDNDLGAWFDNSSGNIRSIVKGCKFLNNAALGLYTEEWQSSQFEGCIVTGNGRGFWCSSSKKVIVAGCTIKDNTEFNVNTDKTLVIPATEGDDYSLSHQEDVEDLHISDSIITGSGKHGIEIRGVRRSFSLTDCHVFDNGLSAAGAAATSGFADVLVGEGSLGQDSIDVKIDGGIIGNVSAGKTQYGVHAPSPQQVTRITVEHVMFQSLEDAIDLTADFIHVSGNQFILCNNITLAGSGTASERVVDETNVFKGGALAGSSFDHGRNQFLKITDANGKATLDLTSTGANVGLTIGGDTTLYRPAANTLKTDDDFYVLGGKRAFLGAPASAPADGLLENGQVSCWLDEGGDALTFKVKYSDGTVKTGTVALT